MSLIVLLLKRCLRMNQFLILILAIPALLRDVLKRRFKHSEEDNYILD